ncbi:MAG: putative bifunctional diguanylate cyclase/phosphodiesterase [Acidimicrobiia bacterium]
MLLIVLVPLLSYGTLAKANLDRHRELRATAEAVSTHLASSVTASKASGALRQEAWPAEMLSWAGTIGVDVSVVEQLLDYQARQEVATTRAAVDANTEAIDELRANGLLSTLEGVRAALDAGTIEPLDTRTAYTRLRAPFTLQWKIDLHQASELLAAIPASVSGSRELDAAVTAIEAASSAYETSDEEVAAFSKLLVPGSDGGSAARIELARATQARALAVDDLVDGEPTIRAEWNQSVGSTSAETTFAGFVDAQLAPGATALNLDDAGIALKSGLARSIAVYDFLNRRLDAASVAAEVLATNAQHDYQRQLNALIAVTAAAAIVALLIARSISNPLRALQQRATAVSSGEVHHQRLPLRGAREVAVATRGLNDAVDTLHTIEQQAEALAAGATAVAAAIDPAPGHLGMVMNESVARLTQSLSERDALQARLAHDASHDALTGLLNRRALLERIEGFLARGSTVGLIFFDLDGFKQTNDGYGHGTGDIVLQAVADRLVRSAPSAAIAARLGGDEFVVVMSLSPAHPHDATDVVTAATRSMIDAIGEPIVVADERHHVGASAGVIISTSNDTASTLLRDADIALYRAKDRGTNEYIVFDDALRSELERRNRVSRELRDALRLGHLEVYFQPLTRSGEPLLNPATPYGVEALVRWNHADGHQVPPNDFIDIAEESNLIVDLDRWVMRDAMAQVVRWRSTFFPDLHLSTNVSGRTLFSLGFIESLTNALAETGLPAQAFTLELTETVLLNDLLTAAQILEQVRALGASVAIDDFGTGYTSIAQLRQLPIDRLKIDRSFVSNLHAAKDRSRVRVPPGLPARPPVQRRPVRGQLLQQLAGIDHLAVAARVNREDIANAVVKLGRTGLTSHQDLSRRIHPPWTQPRTTRSTRSGPTPAIRTSSSPRTCGRATCPSTSPI